MDWVVTYPQPRDDKPGPWFVAITYPHKQKKAQAALAEREISTYFPRFKEKLWLRGQKRERISYLFQRYFFCKFIEDWTAIYAVNETGEDLIWDVLKPKYDPLKPYNPDDDKPSLVSDADVRELRGREDAEGFIHKYGFKKGQRVLVKSGVLMGQIGTFIKLAGDREVALFHILGVDTPVESKAGILVAM